MFESDVEQTTYLSTTTIAAATLTELVSLICGSTWNKWQYACYGIWWATVALTLVSATTTYWLLIRDEEVHLSNLSPTLMYPTTGLAATASAGSVLINYTPISTGLSMPVLVVSYMLLGAGTCSEFRPGSLTLSQASSLPSSPSPPTLPAYCPTRHPLRRRSLRNSSPSLLWPTRPTRTTRWAISPDQRDISWSTTGKGPWRILPSVRRVATTEDVLMSEITGSGFYAAGFVFGLTIWGFATYV